MLLIGCRAAHTAAPSSTPRAPHVDAPTEALAAVRIDNGAFTIRKTLLARGFAKPGPELESAVPGRRYDLREDKGVFWLQISAVIK
jgi:hypothetical protein